MKKIILCLFLIAATAAVFAQNSYLVRIDRNDYLQQTETAVPDEIEVYYSSQNYTLAKVQEDQLRELPKSTYTLLDTFPPDGNWYLLTKLPGRENAVTSALGERIADLDNTILLRTHLTDIQLAQQTEMPFVRMDFTPLTFRQDSFLKPPAASRVSFGNLLTSVNADSIMWFIQSLQDFTTRNAFADNRLDVASWIRDQFIRYGIANAQVEPFLQYGLMQYNVVATIPGSVAPDKYIIIGGHHDSITNNSDPLVFAPGADDNASGAAAALEMARVMHSNNYQPETSLRFVTFACEEYGLWGSKYHSQQTLDQNLDVKLMVNHDMIAHSTVNSPEWYIRLMPYGGFEGYTGYAMDVVQTQTTLTPYPGSLNSASSDSYPFWQKGYPVIYFFEHEFSPYYHSINDITANCNPLYVREAIKASTAVCVTYDQIPSPVDAVTIMDTGSGTSLQISWNADSVEADVVSYKIYYSEDPNAQHLSYTATSSPFNLTGLTDGTTYHIGVAAVDAANNEGLIRFTTGTPYLLPQMPLTFGDNPVYQGIELTWSANNELDLDGYRLYRSTSLTGPFASVTADLITSTTYMDQGIEQLLYYYYYLTAVDTDGNESAPTEVVHSRAVTLNQGILIVDETMNNASNTVFSPNDAVSDLFYDTVLHSFQIAQWDTETDGVLKLADIGVYSSILWHGNDSANMSYPLAVRDELKKYLMAGGKILITSYFPSRAFDNNNNYPFTYQSGNFLYDQFGIQDVDYHTSARFRYALPEGSGFPPLTVDSLKTVLPLAGHIYNIESISANPLTNNIYYYGSEYDNTASQGVMNGMAVGTYFNDGCRKAVVLSFPLFNMKQDEVTNLMYHVFHNVFGETVSNQDENVLPAAGIILSSVYPNPFDNYLNLQIQGAKVNLPLNVTVYNVKGQKIKSLYDALAKNSSHKLTWDGRDEAGSRVANSVYLLRAEQDGKVVSQKIIKLK
ncbi:MAG: M20/M25/M40 family metallo-hydrolase [Candidatus Cloacimonadaceae bacterium]